MAPVAAHIRAVPIFDGQLTPDKGTQMKEVRFAPNLAAILLIQKSGSATWQL